MQAIDIKYKANYYSLLLLGFLLPLYKFILPPAIAIFAITSFINHRWQTKKANHTSKHIFWFLIPFAMYGISILYSENNSQAFANLETKLSLLVFPLLLFIANIDLKKVFPNVLKAFIEGCMIASVLVLVYAGTNYYISGNPDSFIYSRLSFFSHASYFSMYLCFALIILYRYSFSPSKSFYIKPYVSFILIVFFSFMVGLLSSKSGWITLLIIHFGALSYWIIMYKNFIKGSLAIVVITGMALLLYYQSSTIRVRIDDLIENVLPQNNLDSFSSTQSRWYAWDASFTLIKQNPVLGYGCGDTKEILTNQYKSQNLESLTNKQLNAHNQFLQTTLDTGLVGLVILLAFLIYPLLRSFRNHFWLYILFIGLIAINFLTESMLETQSGVIFFAFFHTLFFSVLLQQNQEIKVS